MSNLKPVVIFPRLNPGETVMYQHHRIKLTLDGGLEIDGNAHQNHCVQFTRSFGVGGSCNCIVLLRLGQLEIYEGATIGASMLTREAVLAACH